MAIRIITAPEKEPVSVEDALGFLRIDEDPAGVLDVLIQAARELAEGRTARALITQTLELALDAFPLAGEIRIPKPPLQMVEEITYSFGGVKHTLHPSMYVVDTASEPGRLVPMPGRVWPVADGTPGSVRIHFVAGYGDTGDKVPGGIRTAMLMHIAAWYENPEAVSQRQLHEVPGAASVLLDQARAYGWIG